MGIIDSTLASGSLIDVSVPLHSELPPWPGDTPPEIEQVASWERDGYELRRLTASLHWGTHVDAPSHFSPQGWSIDEIPLKVLMGTVLVVEFPQLSQITARDLQEHPVAGYRRVFIKTRNSQFWQEHPLRFHTEFTALTADAARYLVEQGVQLVGIDYASVDLFEASDLPVHRILYQHNVVGVENLNLSRVEPGEYEMICLPVNIRGAEGAFARVVLIKE